jgi:hypothetical protein
VLHVTGDPKFGIRLLYEINQVGVFHGCTVSEIDRSSNRTTWNARSPADGAWRGGVDRPGWMHAGFPLGILE